MPPQHSLADLLGTTAEFFARKGIDTARLDAEVLLAEVLGLDRLRLYTSFDRPMGTEELDAYRELVRRRAAREPVAYILGRKEFYGRDFSVDPRVLIPRPDTEVLVDEVLERIPEDSESLVLDYGTGSGALALTLAAERPGLRALALDLCAEALGVAKANALALGVPERVGFVRSDGFAQVPTRFEGKVAAIVANPPYIPQEDRAGLMPEVRDHEPTAALFPGPDALVHYRRIAKEGARWLEPEGFVALELGVGQAPQVASLLDNAGWRSVRVRSDLARRDRVVAALRPF